MRTRSLRRRLILYTLAILVVALGSFDVLLYVSFRARLYHDLDRQLVDRAGLAELLDGQLTAQQLANRLSGAGVTATVRHAGAIYRGRPRAPTTTASAPVAAPAPPTPPRGTSTKVVRVGSTLVLRQPLADGTLVLGTDRGPAQAELRRLLILQLLGSAAVLLASGLGVGLLVRRAVRPLDEMTRVAALIAQGRGRQRLAPDRTDTELGRMAAAFDAMVDVQEDALSRAHDSEGRMRALLADVSHELRTPVSGISVTAEALLRAGRSRTAEEEQMLVLMVRQSARAGRLINDLLTLGRLESEADSPRGPVDLTRLAGEEIERARLLAPTLEISLSGSSDRLVTGNGDQLTQLLTNLLDNARHATTSGGSIDVELADDGDGVRLTVSDSGCGIADADRERIFERLVRLDDSRSRDRFGSGLGLSIARSIARGHGGDLICAPSAHGARFVLTLPASATPVPAPAAALKTT